ncbi:MAG: erythromycin esterase family protein [Hyphomonas sp.]
MLHRPYPLSRRNFLMASASAALLSACATRTDPPEEIPAYTPSMASLLAAQAVPIRSLKPDDPGVMALARRLAGAKMAGLGEATHGSLEDALLKSALVQTLVERHGLRVLLLEANRTGTARLDAYASAEPTGLLAAEALKEAPVFRILKTEIMADLLAWLRGWNAVNADRPVRVLGVDCQASSQDAADALAALAAVDSGAAEALSPGLAPILSEEARAVRHDLMLKQLTSAQRAEAETACRTLEAELTAAGLIEAAFAARLAWQGLNAFAYETSDGDMSLATPDYWSRRDVFMGENALTLSAGQQAVFWGHNMHVLGGRPSGDAAGFVPAGAILREALGAGYTALVQDFGEAQFLAYADGEDVSPDAPQIEIRRTARQGTLNALLAEASPRTAWFDLATLPDNTIVQSWRAEPLGYDWYGARASASPLDSDIRRAPPQQLIDLMVFHPVLTPQKML